MATYGFGFVVIIVMCGDGALHSPPRCQRLLLNFRVASMAGRMAGKEGFEPQLAPNYLSAPKDLTRFDDLELWAGKTERGFHPKTELSPKES